MLQSDTTFDGQYKLLKLLGRGGFSEVWLAEDEYIHLQVVLKVYAPGSGMDDDGIQTIGNEFKLMFNLSHPNLLDPRGFSVYNKMPYLVLPYCTKGSVLNLIGRMDEEQVWRFIAQVASGLAYLHERDIIHQDIKPDNILIDDNGSYQITDFGISTKARSTLRKSVLMGNNSGGTTAYMGPERFSREPDPVKASDIWSLGATVFELMTGNLPFGELGGGMQKNGAEIPLIKGDYSDKLKNIVEQMLALETWNRPTAEKLVEWCADQNKITINQTQTASSEPQEPPHSGHATQMMNNEPIAEPPQLQQQQPAKKNGIKVLIGVCCVIGLILFCPVLIYNARTQKCEHLIDESILFAGKLVGKAQNDYEIQFTAQNYRRVSNLDEAESIITKIESAENGPFRFMITPRSDSLQRKLEAKRQQMTPKLIISKTSIVESNGNGGSFDVTISSNEWYYKVTSNQNWCKIACKQDSVLCILLEKNTTGSTRKATVTVGDKTISVTQKAKTQTTLSLNHNRLIDGVNGVSCYWKVEINTNASNYTVTTDKSWCYISDKTNKSFRVNATENTTGSIRTATVTVKAGSLSETISVTQNAKTNANSNTTSNNNITVYVPGYGNLELVYVEGGSFRMGYGIYIHTVHLSSYYIGKYEVTQGLWSAVMGSNPSFFKKGNNYPVEDFSWNDCQEFIKKLNQKTGKKFRLPTEAEWVYAARGGNKKQNYVYSGSNTISSVAWYEDNSNKSTHPVGQKSPNGLGIYDMSGNVAEWCQDWLKNYWNYDNSYFSQSHTNPTGPNNGEYHVAMGGAFLSSEEVCEIDFRSSEPDCGFYWLGLRLVLEK